MTRLLHAYRRAVAWLGRHHQPIAHDFEGEGGLAVPRGRPARTGEPMTNSVPRSRLEREAQRAQQDARLPVDNYDGPDDDYGDDG